MSGQKITDNYCLGMSGAPVKERGRFRRGMTRGGILLSFAAEPGNQPAADFYGYIQEYTCRIGVWIRVRLRWSGLVKPQAQENWAEDFGTGSRRNIVLIRA